MLQVDPIAQNLAQTQLCMKHYVEGGTETLPAHISELQKLREACAGLGMPVSDAQFTRVITLSMPTPSWDPVVGTLESPRSKGGHLTLNTEWSRRQGLTSTGKGSRLVFQTGTRPKWRELSPDRHIKAEMLETEAVKRGNTPRDIIHKPSTLSQTLW